MIKLIISDFDGVLLDLKEIHFEALNRALNTIDAKYSISSEEHLKIFDGLSTSAKLNILSGMRNVPLETFKDVNDLKQKFTAELLGDFKNINFNIKDVILDLKAEGYLFYVASNAVRQTITAGLKILGIDSLVDRVYSNQDVQYSKPNSEIYLRCMATAGVNPSETLIIEDSKHGREAAVKSGAHVCGVDNSFDFTIDRIKYCIDDAEHHQIKWAGRSDLNVLIPMAGAGSRFAQVGYKLPKPLIDVNGKPMIQRVIDNLNINAQYTFIVQKSMFENYNLGIILPLIVPGCKIITTFGLTEGAACTTLLAKDLINNNKHLLITNCDQLVDWDSCDFMYSMLSSDSDGGILTFKANESKWSYAATDELGNVTEVAEKKVISQDATVGIYYWKSGADYVRYAEQMIAKDIRVNNEFYVAPVYNEAIQDNKKIKIFPAYEMHGLGTPEDLTTYLNKK